MEHNAQVAMDTMGLLSTSISELLESPETKGNDLHIIVAEVDGTYSDGMNVLSAISFGDLQKWEEQYDRVAYKKAALSARTGLDSRVVQLQKPWLLEVGDAKFWGSKIRDGLVVAASGVQPWLDEAISGVVLELYFGFLENQTRDCIERSPGDTVVYQP